MLIAITRCGREGWALWRLVCVGKCTFAGGKRGSLQSAEGDEISEVEAIPRRVPCVYEQAERGASDWA